MGRPGLVWEGGRVGAGEREREEREESERESLMDRGVVVAVVVWRSSESGMWPNMVE